MLFSKFLHLLFFNLKLSDRSCRRSRLRAALIKNPKTLRSSDPPVERTNLVVEEMVLVFEIMYFGQYLQNGESNMNARTE